MLKIVALLLALAGLFLWVQSENDSDLEWEPMNGEALPLQDAESFSEDRRRDGPARTSFTSATSLHTETETQAPVATAKPEKQIYSTESPTEEFFFRPKQRWATGRLFISENEALIHAALKMEVAVIEKSEDGEKTFRSFLSPSSTFTEAVTLTIRTDKAGFFRVPIQRSPDSVESRYLVFRLSATSSRSAYDARVAFSKEPSSDNVDVGDVVLQELPLLAQGIIIDSHGVHVPSAYIHAQFLPDNGIFSLSDGVYFNRFSTVEDSQGFRIFGTCPTAQFTLYVQAPGFVSQKRNVSPGSAHLSFVLKKASVVRGQLVLSNGEKSGLLTIELRRNRGQRGRRLQTDEDGRFSFHGQGTGIGWICAFRDPQESRPFYESPAFTILDEQPTDLGTFLIPFQGASLLLDLSGVSFWPRENAPVMTIFDPATNAKVSRIRLGASHLRIMLPLSRCHLEISSFGRRTVRRENVTGGSLPIKMKKGYSVVLQTSQGASASIPIAVHFELTPNSKGLVVRGTKKSSFCLPATGHYAVSAKIFLTEKVTVVGLPDEGSEGQPPSSSVTTFPMISSEGLAVDVTTKMIDVRDMDEPQSFQIVLDQQSVNEAIDELLRSR